MKTFMFLLSSCLIMPTAYAGPITELRQKFRDAVQRQVDYHREHQMRVADLSSRSLYGRDRSREVRRDFYHNKKRKYKREKKRIFRPVPSQIKAHGRNTFVFNPRNLSWGAYDADGRLINSGRASGGRGYCSDVGRGCKTPVGNFSVYRKGHSGCKSSKYPLGKGGAPMPYCMFFRGGYAIHGSPDVPNYNASHGCIRVPTSDARWLHKNFIDHGTKVIVRPY